MQRGVRLEYLGERVVCMGGTRRNVGDLNGRGTSMKIKVSISETRVPAKSGGIPATEVLAASGDCPTTVSVQWRMYHQGVQGQAVGQLSSRWQPGKKKPIRHVIFPSRVCSSVGIHKNKPHQNVFHG